jgi:LacI family transcriptional regulator
MVQEVLAAEGERPTAIFCANNFIGFGAIRALREAGLRVPDDMSVVAFDDLPEEWVSEPFLTVAAQPAYEIGHRAVTLLLDHIAGAAEPAGESIVLPFELIIRRSSGPPPVPSTTAVAAAAAGGIAAAVPAGSPVVPPTAIPATA